MDKTRKIGNDEVIPERRCCLAVDALDTYVLTDETLKIILVIVEQAMLSAERQRPEVA